MKRLIILVFWLSCAAPAASQEAYGARGIYPIYEAGGQWVVFDKRPARKGANPLAKGSRFLVIGSAGAEIFSVARTSAAYGAVCRDRKPAKAPTALLVGSRKIVGRPIIGISVPASFSLKGSRAVYSALSNTVTEHTYAELGKVLATGATKIDFGSPLNVKGVAQPFVFVEETQEGDTNRRCVRLASGGSLVGDCAEMPRALMAETALLRFVSYDPSGKGSVFLLAFTPTPPLWGDERWGFVVRPSGPKLFLMDAMDPRCREGF